MSAFQATQEDCIKRQSTFGCFFITCGTHNMPSVLFNKAQGPHYFRRRIAIFSTCTF